MKKLFTILFATVLAFTINAQNIMLQNGSKGVSKSNDQFSGFRATFSYNEIESTAITGTERGTFSTLSIAGAMPAGAIGSPELPVFKQFISVPVGATPKVAVKNYTTNEYHLGEYGINMVYPVQPDVPKNVKLEDVPFVYDTKAYSENTYTNSAIAEVEILGTMRGVIIGMLVVHPIQYNPAAHTVMTYNNIEVEVTFDNGDYQKTEDLFVNTYSPYFQNMYDIVFNKGVSKDLFNDHPDLYSTPVRMLVIAGQMFKNSPSLASWIEWKKKKGFYMDVHYAGDPEVGSTLTSIKAFCQSTYNAGAGNGTAPTFVVIVGDIQQVVASKTGTGADGNKGSDLYYGSIDGDYFPEMYYSRLSAQTEQQLANQIEKILYYEKYQFADPTYLDNVLLIAGWDGTWNATVGQPTINYAANYYYNAAHGYANVYKYLNQSQYSGCYNNFNTGVGFANYTAHGSITAWSDPSFSVTNANALTNTNKYFIAMGNCCLAADFNSDVCLGEAMMRGQQKGAVGYIGSCPLTYWHDDLHFGVGAYLGSWSPANPTLANTKDGVYDVSFRDVDFNCLSSFVFAGNLNVTYAKTTPGYTADQPPLYYWEAYHVLGDASLMPYNGQAANNTVSHLPVIYIGVPTYEVNAVPGSYVAISKDGVLLGTAVANAAGVATVTLNPPITSAGNVDIVVTRNQRKPYMAQVPATAQSGPYIIQNGYTVVGGGSLTYISTNKDIAVTLKNVGVAQSGTLNVTISCTDPQLTINNATATCGNIAPNGTATVNFNVTVAHNIPNNKNFQVHITITGGANSWESNMLLTALAPNITLDKVLVNGSETGTILSGSVLALTAVVKNDGGADAYSVTGNIQIGSQYFTPACNEMYPAAQNLPAGQSINIPYYLTVSPSMPNNHQANFNLLLNAQYDISANIPFTVSASGAGNYCVPGSSNCNSYNDRITSLIIIKNSNQSTILSNTNPTCNTGGYTDYTATAITFEAGASYTVKVKTGYQNHRVRGWIDLNGNYTFDSNELMFTISCASANVEYTATFTIPQNYVPGAHRFRIRTRDNSNLPEPCDTYSYGQTLDYTANLLENYPRVQNVSATLNGSNINVVWSAPTSGTPTGYNVYRDGIKLNATPLTALNYTETNVTEGIYVYSVTAVYTGNNESLPQISNVICNNGAVVPQLCEKPVGLLGSANGNTAHITWSAPTNIDGVLLGYNIYRGGVKIGETVPSVREYSDINLANGTYIYKVSAKYEHCPESALTDGVSITVFVPQFCEKPLNLSGSANGTTAVITWSTPAPIDGVLLGYNIYRGGVKIGETAPAVREYSDPNLANGTYIYKVSAKYTHCSESALTDGVSVTVFVPQFCEKPLNLSGTSEESTATITWNEPTPIDGVLLGYNIYRDDVKIGETAPAVREFSDTNLANGTYTYKVSAKYEHCPESALTDGVSITVFVPQFCEKPLNLSGTSEESTAIITWNEPDNIDGILLGYNIYRDGTNINTSPITNKEYSEELPDGTYSYQVSAVYEHCAESELTDEIKVIIITDAINDFQTLSFEIFPNPANNEITFKGNGLARVEIYEVQGRKLAEYENVEDVLQINVSQYQNGIYFAKMYSNNSQMVTKRLVIVR